jgi:hypothetical protein
MLVDRIDCGTASRAESDPRRLLRIAHVEAPLSGEELLTAWVNCDRVRGKLLTEMRQYPVLLMPVCSVPAFRHGEREWNVGAQTVAYLDAMRFTQWFNLLGGPAAVIPVGRSPENLPIGIQTIAGRPYQDDLVLGIAAVVERDFGYLPPPLAASSDPSMPPRRASPTSLQRRLHLRWLLGVDARLHVHILLLVLGVVQQPNSHPLPAERAKQAIEFADQLPDNL